MLMGFKDKHFSQNSRVPQLRGGGGGKKPFLSPIKLQHKDLFCQDAMWFFATACVKGEKKTAANDLDICDRYWANQKEKITLLLRSRMLFGVLCADGTTLGFFFFVPPATLATRKDTF